MHNCDVKQAKTGPPRYEITHTTVIPSFTQYTLLTIEAAHKRWHDRLHVKLHIGPFGVSLYPPIDDLENRLQNLTGWTNRAVVTYDREIRDTITYSTDRPTIGEGIIFHREGENLRITLLIFGNELMLVVSLHDFLMAVMDLQAKPDHQKTIEVSDDEV